MTVIHDNQGHPIEEFPTVSGSRVMPVKIVADDVQSDGTQQTKVTDVYGFKVENTPTGEMRTVEPVRLCGSTFTGPTIDTNFWTVYNANGGATTQAGSQMTLASNTNASGYTVVRSVAVARHIGGSINRFRAQLRLNNAGSANNSRKWGAYNGSDGCYFELDGTTLYIVTVKNNVPTRVASSSWNGSTTVPTLTNTTTYEIYITSARVYFSISDVLVHTASFPTTTWTDTTNLPIEMSSINSGSTTNNTIEARAVTIFRLGKEDTQPRYKHISTAATTVLKYGPGQIHNIVVNNPTNNTITVYDNFAASGNVIAIIDPDAGATPFALDYHVPFNVGLTVVTAGTPDLTVVYE